METEKSTYQRLMSLDALRGFDMFWIISGEGIIHGAAESNKSAFLQQLSAQFHHSPWNGFTFYDLIFPLFIFISGVSMPFSIGKRLSQPLVNRNVEKKSIYRSLLKRTITLIILGMLINRAHDFMGYDNTRFASVLGRIALANFGAAMIFINNSPKKQYLWFFFLLLGYWACMAFIPVPGFGAGVLSPEGNLASYIDKLILPGKILRGTYDPEGIFTTIPAVCTALLGVFTGQFLKTSPLNGFKKTTYLCLYGIACLLLAALWNCVFPINKNLWTSSFVLFTGGISLLLFALFYIIIDVLKFQRWSLPWIWIGSNSILIYLLAHGPINFLSLSQYFFSGIINFTNSRYHTLLLWIGVLLIQLFLLRFLYNKKLFWKI